MNSLGKRHPLTILVVEDEWFVRMSITQFLEAAGCAVVEAESGERALSILQQRNGIDVVFTDIRLGGTVNGWDVGEASRATHPDIPVVYASGAMITPPRKVAGSLFFDKPYRPEEILSACRTLTRSLADVE